MNSIDLSLGWKPIPDTQHPKKEVSVTEDPIEMSLHQTNN